MSERASPTFSAKLQFEPSCDRRQPPPCGQNLRHFSEHFVQDARQIHAARIAGHEVLALRQGIVGELGYELQGPAKYAPEVYCAILEAGKDFAIRRLGGRTATDYLRAIFDDPMAEYLAEFKATMPDYAAKFNIAGSFEADDGSAWYRSR